LEKGNKSGLELWIFVIPTFLLVFLVFVDHLVVIPLSADISRSTGLPIVNSGLLVAIYPISAAISAFVFAPFSDRLGRKTMLMILGCGFAISTLFFALSSSVFYVFLFRITSGIFGGPIFPNALAFIGDSFSGKQRGTVVTLVMFSFSISSIMGVPLGSWIGDQYTWQVPFFGISIGALFCSFAVISFKSVKTGAESGNILKQYLELISLWKISNIRRLFIIQFFMMIGLFGFVPNISVWLGTNFGLSPTSIGLCYMQGGIGALIGNFLAGRLLWLGYRESLISIGSVIMGCFLLVATFEFFPVNFIGMIFAGIMFGGSIRIPSLQMILTEIVSIDIRGRLMSMSMIVSNFTMGLGGIWSIPLLKIDSSRLHGMEQIGIIAIITLAFVPILILNLKTDH